jgi:sarcosine oxidase subunit gamma
MSELSYQSPLAGVAEPQGLSISIREITERGMIDLRGLTSDPAFMAAAKGALGVDLPTRPRTSASWGDVRVLWLSTDQWLVLTSRARAHELLTSLRDALKGIHSLVVDVSDMRAVIRLEGDGCREVIMKGTSLDLLDKEYVQGCCRRMRYAEIAALLDVV